jgi:ferredoxin
MMHPGLPPGWAALVGVAVVVLSLRTLVALRKPAVERQVRWIAPSAPGAIMRHVAALGPWLLLVLKIALAALFLRIVTAGLFGSSIPERNLATVLTWNVWWAGLILTIFFVGSFWCAVCPWDTLAGWLVRRRLVRRASPNNSLNLRVPRMIRSVWPALLLFIGLTWLELGTGLTTTPRTTAILGLAMVVLATVSLALFERKAFCRYFCPVGRTIGFYSQLAPVELRPADIEVCARCTSLECYHGTDRVEPCPTHLVMGRLTENTYCTSCGNCVSSCPSKNIFWRLRPPSIEAMQNARPHWDEACFMLALLALTDFHGITMMPLWKEGMGSFARLVSDSGTLLLSFTIALLASLAVPTMLYSGAVAVTHRIAGIAIEYKQLFSGLAFVALPLAFAYHLAHNLGHVVRESTGIWTLFSNPLGTGMQPLSVAEKQARHMELLIRPELLFTLQAGLMLFGFWVALQVLRHRGQRLLPGGALTGFTLLPMILLAVAFTGFHLWLLMQPMAMRL